MSAGKQTKIATPSLDRVRRIKGQICGIEKMIEAGKEFPEVMIQLKAASSAIRSLEGVLLGTHIKRCLKGRAASRNVDDLVGLIGRSL